MIYLLFGATQIFASDAPMSIGTDLIQAQGRFELGTLVQFDFNRINSNPPNSVQNFQNSTLAFHGKWTGKSDILVLTTDFYTDYQLLTADDTLTTNYSLKNRQGRSLAKMHLGLIRDQITVGLGFDFNYWLTEETKVTGINIQTTTNLDKTFIARPCGHVLKQGSQLKLGALVCLGAGNQRKFYQQSSDGFSTHGSFEAYQPSEYTLLVNFPLLNGINTTELSFIQLGDHPEKSPSGNTMHQDAFRIANEWKTADTGGVNYHVAGSFTSSSYADQSYMTLDNINLTRVRLRSLLSNGAVSWGPGILLLYGKDTQSLPQLNAKYTHLSGGLEFLFISQW